MGPSHTKICFSYMQSLCHVYLSPMSGHTVSPIWNMGEPLPTPERPETRPKQPKASSKGPSHRKILYANFLPCRPISSLTRHSMSLQKHTHCITNLGTSAPPSQPQNSQRHAQNTTFVKIRPTRPIVAQILNFIEFT